MITVEKLWPNSTIACVATGPSLTQADARYLRGKLPVIAVNDAHLLCPWADVLYSSDHRWWFHHDGVPKFAGRKYGVGRDVGKADPYDDFPEIQILMNTGVQGLELDPIGLKTGMNSGYAAINLAVHLGATKILLLGYNLSYLFGKAHFFGNHPQPLQPSIEAKKQPKDLYPSFLRNFETLVEPLKQAQIEVINCTPRSALTFFPIQSLRDVLPEVAA